MDKRSTKPLITPTYSENKLPLKTNDIHFSMTKGIFIIGAVTRQKQYRNLFGYLNRIPPL